MNSELLFTIRTSLIVALGGFLMGFDASVISGVVGFIELEFALTKIQLGWAVASLALSSTFAMLVAGPLSQIVGRRKLLTWAAVLYLISALGSAFAPDFVFLIAARMIGGLAVGAALILAPMYIAELAPPAQRGRLVSINQLNIVIGISVAFFSNYLILAWSQSDSAIVAYLKIDIWQWRWMLGLEALPALFYLVGLRFVPESPRWLIMKNRPDEALSVLTLVAGPTQAKIELTAIANSLSNSPSNNTGSDSLGIATLFSPTLHKVLFVGMVVAILQQITGINSVFFYAPMIFEQTGIGTDASFLQAVLVGLTNLFFTILAMLFIDKVGRRPLLLAGVSGIVVCMLMLAYGFDTARYTLPVNALSEFSEKGDTLASVAGQTFRSDVAFREAISNSAGAAWYTANEARLIQISVSLNSYLILFGILGFVASFAVSLGPVMWVLFSELFPNHIRALAISVVGLVNSAVSFLVQLVFPWELATIGIAGTFFIYGFFALVGLLFVAKFLPETKGMSLEQLEVELVKS